MKQASTIQTIRPIIFWLALAALLIYSGWAVFKTETAIANGTTVYVELAPVDPRSLIQGDYMALNYAVSDELELGESSGRLVITTDAEQVASFIRVADGNHTPLAANELLINYSRDWSGWGNTIIIGTNSYFFQEGTGELFETAKYGEFKVAADGTPILVGLRDEKLNLLGELAR
ncbi:MAG: putative membrane-anchored protein [Cellvibrionaceae bacterium]|jgi:uncharacterized membrane-anchored protein